MTAQILRRGSAVLAAALATAALAACSAAAPAQPAPAGSTGRPGVAGISGPPVIHVNPDAGSAGYNVRPRITVPPVPPAGSPEPSLPINAYIQTSVQQDGTLSTAAAQVAQRCVSAAGFRYPVAPRPNYEAILTQQFDHQNAGLTSLAQARSYGFQPPPDVAKIFAIRHIGQLPGFAAEQRKHGTAWASALVGEVPGMKPGTPPLGCMRAANTLLFGNFNGSLVGGTPDSIDFNAIKWTDSDPHVLAAQRTWSACMARHGLRFRTMQDLTVNRAWPNPPTPAEIAAAVTEVRCNHQANLANTYLAVEAAYQQALIGQNQPDLQKMQADFGTLQKRAEQVLALPAADILRFSKARVHQVIYLLVPRVKAGHQGT